MDEQPSPIIQSAPVNPQPNNVWKIVAIIVAGILVIGGVSYGSYYLWQKYTGNIGGRVCTADVKLCPDGSYVGRTGFNCKFAACPDSSCSKIGAMCGGIAGIQCCSGLECELQGNYPDASGVCADALTTATADWQTHSSTKLGFTFKYPKEYAAPQEQENYLSLISPLNPNRIPKMLELQDGELKIEIVVESGQENDSVLKCWNDHSSGGGEIISQAEAMVDGIKTTVLTWKGLGTGQFICFSHNSRRYLINKYPAETTRQSEYNQILSTFKFIDPIVGWQTYTDSNNGFEFRYPVSFSVHSGDHPDYPQGSFLKAHGGPNVSAPINVVAILPQNFYPNTNFVSAWLAVANDPIIANNNDCRDFEKNGNVQQLSQTQVVNGETWYKGIIGGAATGTSIENRVYHILHNDICYEVDLNLATTGDGKAANANDVWDKLEGVFATFKFIPR